MANLFPLIEAKDCLFDELAVEVLGGVLQSPEEYTLFQRKIVELFNADVAQSVRPRL